MITTMRSAVDAFTRQIAPDKNFGLHAHMTLTSSGASDERKGFIFFARPFPVGATVSEALLRIYTRGSGWTSGGPHTITAQRISQAWLESGAGSITHNNQPTVAGTTVAHNAGSPAADTLIEIDVTDILAEAAAGSDFFGIRLIANTSTGKQIHSSEAFDAAFHPELVVTWSTAPGAPTDLRPGGARLVDPAQPTFTWSFNDADGDDQSAFQVQIDDDSAFGSPLRDTGYVTSAEQQYVLESASLTDGTTYYWRVRAKDEAGVESEWSDAAEFARDIKGVVAITSPSATTDDLTPVITHTFTGETQAAVRYLLYERDETDDEPQYELVFDSGIRKTTALSFTLQDDDGDPLIRGDDGEFTYKVEVRVFDTKARQATPGDPRYAFDTQEFTYARSGAPDAVESLTVTTDDSPAYVLEWTRTNTPDFFAIKVDGRFGPGLKRIDPEDVRVDATTYTYTLWALDPATEHTFEVEAVVNGEHSDANPTETAEINPADAWLIVPARDLQVRIATAEQADYVLGEGAAIFTPVGRRDPVRIVDVIRGYEGTIRGGMLKADRPKLENIKSWARRGNQVLLVHADRHFPIALGQISCVVRPGTRNNQYDVTVEFWQTGNFSVRKR